jgi:hypothetical protein
LERLAFHRIDDILVATNSILFLEYFFRGSNWSKEKQN